MPAARSTMPSSFANVAGSTDLSTSSATWTPSTAPGATSVSSTTLPTPNLLVFELRRYSEPATPPAAFWAYVGMLPSVPAVPPARAAPPSSSSSSSEVSSGMPFFS